MTTKPFDPTKPVQTREGKPARIICTDFNHFEFGKCMVAAVCSMHYRCGESAEYTVFYDPYTGYKMGERSGPLDLVNVPEVKKTYQNYYKNGRGGAVWHDKNRVKMMSDNRDFDFLVERTFEDEKLTKVEVIDFAGQKQEEL